jgi:hypothetical protein
MTTTPPRATADYAAGYAQGRTAAKEHLPVAENPFRPGSSAFHGWNDGHYDEQSARIREIKRHSAMIWTPNDAN